MADHQAHDAYGQYLLDPPLSLDIDGAQSQSQLTTPSSASDSSSILFGASHGFLPAASQGYAHHHQHTPHQTHISSLELTLDPSQLNSRPSSIGPNRVVTRRQARIAQESAAYATAASCRIPQNQRQHHFGDAFVWNGSPSELHISTTISQHQSFTNASPPHPSTPSSVSSGFSHYGFHPYASGPRGHSRSTSSATNPRSTSPAASIASAATSISSGHRSRPPISSGSASSIQSASKPKKRLTNKQRKEICMYYEEHPTSRQEDIAKIWDVERSTVSKILKNKPRWMQVDDNDSMADVSKSRSSKFPLIETVLSMWLRDRTEGRKPVSDIEIRTRAKEIAKERGIGEDKFKASAGWVENFKHRNNIKKGIFQGVSMPDPETFVPEDHDTESTAAMMARAERDDLLRAVDESALRSMPEQSTALGIHVGISQPTSSEASAGPVVSPVQGLSDIQHSDGRTHAFQYPVESTPSSHVSNAMVPSQGDLRLQHGVSCQMQPGQTEGTAFWGSLAQVPATNMRHTPSVDVSARDAFSAMEVVMRFLSARPLNGLSEADTNLLTDLRHHIYAETARDANNAANARAAAAAAANNQPTMTSAPPLLGMPTAIHAGALAAAS